MSVKQMKNSGKKKAGAKTDLFEVKKTAKPLRSNAVKRHAKPAKGKTYAKRAKSPNGYCWWAAPLLLLSVVVVALLGVLACREYVAYASFQTQVESALNDTFFDGVCVDNWEMTGLNLADALTAFDARVESGYRNRSLYFDTGDDESFLLTCEELGYKSNYENVIGEAWHYGRSGSLEERYRSINDVSANKITFSVARTLYDPEKLRTVTDRIAQKYTREMKNAGITDFDFSTRTFLFSQEVSGSYVDGDALYRQACALLDNGGGILTIKIERQEPTITVADVRSYYGKITEAVTNASSSSNNRLINLNLACKSINGTALAPGETFSFNDVVGKRTKEKGYKLAGVYTNGEVGEDIGGGVCQVSTTLWNAAMKADCEIVERHEHSRPVTYVDKGKDATVSWGMQDMKFKNTSDETLYIVAYLREDKRVLVEIYGRLLPDGSYIKIEAKTTRKISPGEPERIYNPVIPKGQEVVVSEARTGYKAEAYRVYYSADDVELKREFLCSSYYKESAAKIEYGG